MCLVQQSVIQYRTCRVQGFSVCLANGRPHLYARRPHGLSKLDCT